MSHAVHRLRRNAVLTLVVVLVPVGAAAGRKADPPGSGQTIATSGGATRPVSPRAVASRTWHVSSLGLDLNPGTAVLPFATVQRGVDAAAAGDTILVHAGTYDRIVAIAKSGRPGAPIVLRSAGDGEAILTATLARQPCSATDPTRERTIQVLYGADRWIFRDLTVVGGILVSGKNPDRLQPHLKDRTLPGRGMYDPGAARATIASLGADPADGIHIVGNKIGGRGINAVAARDGLVLNNEISDIDCGTGGAVLVSRFSDGWSVQNNYVHDVEASEKHWMSEGIRFSGASMYGLVARNTVEDVADPGRGIGMDVNSGWNVIRDNVVRRAFQGLSEQSGGWGNQWIGNVAEENRGYGFNILGAGAGKRKPGPATPSYMVVRCNVASGSPVALSIGTIQTSTFETNSFGTVKISPQLRSYWASAGNTWDGSSKPPSATPPRQTCP